MSRVLVAVDGSGHGGLAAAYLINRARSARREYFLVVTVDPPKTAAPPHHVSPLADLTSAHSIPARTIAESAGPWLENAGIECEFRGETGDVSNIIVELTRKGDFKEVVLVSGPPANPFVSVLRRIAWHRRSVAIDHLRAMTKLPVSLVASKSAMRVHRF